MDPREHATHPIGALLGGRGIVKHNGVDGEFEVTHVRRRVDGRIEMTVVSTRALRRAFDREHLTIEEACGFVGVSRRTLYNWINGGKLETVRTASGSLRILKHSLFPSAKVDAPPVNK